MNVTVAVPRTLRPFVDGRRQVELGVPHTADVGDVLQTLISLYPKLKAVMASDRRPGRQQLLVFLGERGVRDMALGQSGLRNGDRLYLCAMPPGPTRAAGERQGA